MAEDAQPQPEPRKPLSLLASERFGREFVGEVKQPEPEPAPDPDIPNDPDATANAADTDGVAAEEPTEDDQPGGDEPGPEDGSETVPIETLGELAQHYDLDPEWTRTLKVPVQVNGTASEIPLSDAINAYQIGQATEERLQEAKAHAQASREERAAKLEEAEAQLASVATLVGSAEKLLQQDETALERLRDTDPAEWSAKKAELADRRASIEEVKNQAAETWRENQAKLQKENTTRLQERLSQEAHQLLEKLPEWHDADRARTEKAELSQYLASQGFSEQEIANAIDHRTIVVARKAMLFDRQNTTGTVARKKLAKVPKMLKPGTPKPQDQRDRDRISRARGHLRQTGSIDAALEVMRAKRGAAR